MRLFLPHDLDETVKQLGLRDKWINKRREFDRDKYLGMVESCRALVDQQVGSDARDQPLVLQWVIAGALHHEQEFIDRVHDEGFTYTDENEWVKVCRAGAWSLMQAYFREVNNNRWTTTMPLS